MRPLVLIVDDNPDNLEYAAQVLGDAYEVELAPSGTAAVMVSKRAPDLVLLDISLPRRDGFEVLGDLRADPTTRDVPIVACTAHAICGDRERILGRGFDAYLSKPYRPRELLGVVDRFLGPGARASA